MLNYKHITLIFIGLISISTLISCGNNSEAPTEQNETALSPYIDSLTQAINQTPEKALLYAQRGEAFYNVESYDAAIKDLTKALELDAETPEYYRILANTYLDYYKSKEALDVLEQATERFPTDVSLLLKLAEFQMIVKQHGASIQTANSVLEISPMNPEAFYMMGANYQMIGDTTKAINSFQTAVEQNPDLLEGFYELGLLWENKGNGELALQYYNNALEINPYDIPSLYAKGMYYTNRKMDNEAIETFKTIHQIDREYADPYFNVGIIYLEHDSLKQAYANFNIAAEVEPTMTKAFYYRAVTSEKMGNIEQAITDYKNARNLDKNDEYLADIEQKLKKLKKQ